MALWFLICREVGEGAVGLVEALSAIMACLGGRWGLGWALLGPSVGALTPSHCPARLTFTIDGWGDPGCCLGIAWGRRVPGPRGLRGPRGACCGAWLRLLVSVPVGGTGAMGLRGRMFRPWLTPFWSPATLTAGWVGGEWVTTELLYQCVYRR